MTKVQEQLQNNVEDILGGYMNGMLDEPENYPKLTKEEAREYCLSQIYDMRADSRGGVAEGACIANNLKFLGNEYIFGVIDKCAEEFEILRDMGS